MRFANTNGTIVKLPNKAAALITYLLLAKSDLESKEFIKGLLWSESSQQRASGSLRQCLKKLNDVFETIGFNGFASDGQDIRLQRDSIALDLEELHTCLQAGQIPDLASDSLSPENLMANLDGQDPSLDSWIAVQRQTWSAKFLTALEQQLRNESKFSETGMQAARLLFSLDPTHEEACRFLMAFYAERDNIGPVMSVYEQLCTELDDKYGSEPSTETSELYLSIQNNTFEAQQKFPLYSNDPPQKISDHIPTIGINQFLWSGESTDASLLLATGFRKELMATLSRFREWIVIDTESRSGKIDQSSDPDYLLEGTCFQVDNFTDVIITVTDKRTGQIWSETPRIETQSWFAAQRTIISKIAVALNVYLSTAKLNSTVAYQGYSSSAQEEWLRGYQNMLTWDPVAEQQAESTFRRIIDAAPDFAPAYSSLATVLNSRHFKHIGMYRNPEDAKAALSYARRSVDIDPLESRTQLALGFSYAMNNQFEQAQLHLTLARELNPHSPVSLVPCAHGLSYCGLHDEAMEMAAWAESINWKWMPRFHWGYILCIRFLGKDLKGALRAAQMADGVIVDLHAWHAAALAIAGNIEEAKQTADTFIELATDRWIGPKKPGKADIVDWFLHCFPIRNDEDISLLQAGLARAGLTGSAPSP